MRMTRVIFSEKLEDFILYLLDSPDREITIDEFMHLAKLLNAFWSYDYKAAKNGKPGLHALLKSGLHSDAFLVLKLILEDERLLKYFSKLMSNKLEKAFEESGKKPDFVVGVPTSATMLGEEIGKMLGIPCLKMGKIDGKIKLIDPTPDNSLLLIIEDVCTRGSGFTEAVLDVLATNPNIVFFPVDPVIVNRGGLHTVEIEDIGGFHILPIVDLTINDWTVEKCPLCQGGSETIPPKKTPENWTLINNSQK